MYNVPLCVSVTHIYGTYFSWGFNVCFQKYTKQCYDIRKLVCIHCSYEWPSINLCTTGRWPEEWQQSSSAMSQHYRPFSIKANNKISWGQGNLHTSENINFDPRLTCLAVAQVNVQVPQGLFTVTWNHEIDSRWLRLAALLYQVPWWYHVNGLTINVNIRLFLI